MASSAGNDGNKSRAWHELSWWERARTSLTQAAGWLLVSAILLFVLGQVLPRLGGFAGMISLYPNIFILFAALIASALASWRSGKDATERVGPIFALVALIAIVAEANSWHLFSFERPGEFRAIIERQERLIEMWQACIYDEDAEMCSEAQSEEEQLDDLQARREALLR